MQTDELVAAIDTAIAALQQAKSTLSGIHVKRGPGRPKKVEAAVPKKRQLSAETRARMAAAQQKRRAKAKRAAKKASRLTA